MCLGVTDVLDRMRRNANRRCAISTPHPQGANFRSGKTVAGKMHAVCSAGKGYIAALVEQQAGYGRIRSYGDNSFFRQTLQFARTQVFLP